MSAEENLANLLRKRYHLENGFDIFEFAERFIDIEEDEIPGGLDGIFLKSNTRDRPLIIVNTGGSQTRKVFTLAHELGHYFIPWHVSPLFLDRAFEGDEFDTHSQYELFEREANRFASEFLMPTEWVKEILGSERSLIEVVRKIKVSGVSASAAAMKIMSSAFDPIVLCETTKRGIVRNVWRSTSVRCNLPRKDTIINEHLYINSPCEIETINNGQWLWWRIAPEENKNQYILNYQSIESSKNILEQILIDLEFLDKSARETIHKSFVGSAGGVKSSYLGKFREGKPFDIKLRLINNAKTNEKLMQVAQHQSFERLVEIAVMEMNIDGYQI